MALCSARNSAVMRREPCIPSQAGDFTATATAIVLLPQRPADGKKAAAAAAAVHQPAARLGPLYRRAEGARRACENSVLAKLWGEPRPDSRAPEPIRALGSAQKGWLAQVKRPEPPLSCADGADGMRHVRSLCPTREACMVHARIDLSPIGFLHAGLKRVRPAEAQSCKAKPAANCRSCRIATAPPMQLLMLMLLDVSNENTPTWHHATAMEKLGLNVKRIGHAVARRGRQRRQRRE